jgi:hypothetical protein
VACAFTKGHQRINAITCQRADAGLEQKLTKRIAGPPVKEIAKSITCGCCVFGGLIFCNDVAITAAYHFADCVAETAQIERRIAFAERPAFGTARSFALRGKALNLGAVLPN